MNNSYLSTYEVSRIVGLSERGITQSAAGVPRWTGIHKDQVYQIPESALPFFRRTYKKEDDNLFKFSYL